MNVVNWDAKKIATSKIVCVGRNYIDHIKELSNEIPDAPVIFLKPNSAISQNLQTNKNDVIHYEGEITFLINENKLAAVGFGIDLTKRALQAKLKSKGLPWERAKSFDNSTVFSDFVSFNGNISDLRMELFINDNLIQSGACNLMLNQSEKLLEEVKSFLTFEDGDLLMCGTPKGSGAVNIGDKFVGKIFENDTLIVERTWLAN